MTVKQVTYFCRLCRRYDIKTRLSHLELYHKTSREVSCSKKSNKDILSVLFVECKTV
jgi:hypothetical protein